MGTGQGAGWGEGNSGMQPYLILLWLRRSTCSQAQETSWDGLQLVVV